MKQLESLQVSHLLYLEHLLINIIILDNRDFRESVAPFTGSVFFFEGSSKNRSCFLVPIFQDDIYENRESFNITLSLSMGVTLVKIDLPVTEVFILDEERE